MMLRQAHSISWSVLEGTFCGSEALCVIEQLDLPGWGMSWPCAMKRKCWSTAGAAHWAAKRSCLKPAGMEAAVATEARQAARAGLIRVYSVVKDYGSRAGTDLLAAERAELQVTAWVMRRKRRDKEQAEEMSGGYFHRHESQNWLPYVVAAIGPIV
eukprot:COSAG01_NODE_417_length_17291_cov_610.598825_8_plen_156_part_00